MSVLLPLSHLAWNLLLFWEVFGTAQALCKSWRHLIWRKTGTASAILVSKLILVISFLWLRWILFWWLLSSYIGLRLLTWSLLELLIRIVQILTFPCVASRSVGTPLCILLWWLLLWLIDECGHIILDILVHEQIVISSIIKKHVLIVLLQQFKTIVAATCASLIEVQRASLLLLLDVFSFWIHHFLSMLFQEQT